MANVHRSSARNRSIQSATARTAEANEEVVAHMTRRDLVRVVTNAAIAGTLFGMVLGILIINGINYAAKLIR